MASTSEVSTSLALFMAAAGQTVEGPFGPAYGTLLGAAGSVSPSAGPAAKASTKSAPAPPPSKSPASPAPSAADAPEDPATFERVISLLESRGVSFGRLDHEPTKTSAESAAVRGATLESGAKAMLMKAGQPLADGSTHVLVVLSAARKADM